MNDAGSHNEGKVGGSTRWMRAEVHSVGTHMHTQVRSQVKVASCAIQVHDRCLLAMLRRVRVGVSQ